MRLSQALNRIHEYRSPISCFKSETVPLRRHKRRFTKRDIRFMLLLEYFFVFKEISIFLKGPVPPDKEKMRPGKPAFCLFRFFSLSMCLTDK